jgi:hypothetical protein
MLFADSSLRMIDVKYVVSVLASSTLLSTHAEMSSSDIQNLLQKKSVFSHSSPFSSITS